MEKQIRIILADQKKLTCHSLKSYLSTFKEFELCCAVATGRALLDALKKITANLLIIDPQISDMGGRQAMEVIRERYPDLKMIVITDDYNEESIKEFILLGARSCFSLNLELSDLSDAIFKLQEKKFHFSKEVLEIISEEYISLQSSSVKANLNPRDREILALLSEGNSVKEAAAKLEISESTFKYHQKKIYKKTNAHSLFQAIKNAQK